MPDGSPHTLRQAALLPLLYAHEQSSGWSGGMAAVTHALLAKMRLLAGPVIEIGCGGGQFLATLQPEYSKRMMIGADLHPLALAHATDLLPSSIHLVQAALPNLPWEDEQFSLIYALDVFDQQGVDMDAAVAEAYRLLLPGGALVMRVSAHPRLYGAHDLAFHTGQRYTRTQLRDALVQVGFAVERLTYANTVLATPVAILRLAQRWGLLSWQPDTYQQSYFHLLAAWILHQEARWLRYGDLPWGLSLCAVARKA